IKEKGGRSAEVLRVVKPGTIPSGKSGADALHEAVLSKDMEAAEKTFAALAAGKPEDAFDQLLYTVEDCLDVHRVVLPHRAYALLPIVGKEHAQTLLRQSVHYCVKNGGTSYYEHFAGVRALLPKLLDQHKLPRKEQGTRQAEDAWVDALSMKIFKGKPD